MNYSAAGISHLVQRRVQSTLGKFRPFYFFRDNRWHKRFLAFRQEIVDAVDGDEQIRVCVSVSARNEYGYSFIFLFSHYKLLSG